MASRRSLPLAVSSPLSRGKTSRINVNFRFRRDVVSGIQNNQILDSAADAPVSPHVCFALITSVKPPTHEGTSCLLGPIPIARKNVRAAHDDFLVLRNLHFNAPDCRADVTWLYGHARVVQSADTSV